MIFSKPLPKMQCIFIFLLFGFSLLFANPENPPEYQGPEVVVTASRNSVQFSELTRFVDVLDQSDLQAIPAQSVIELLEYVQGVDVQQRGPNGIQADIGIRGGTFEQTLILIDGIKVSDPQTGHHNLNLPLAMNDIERIEVLKGPGSTIFGPNALSGAINIITRKNVSNKISGEITTGQNNLWSGNLNGTLSISNFNQRVSVSRSLSDGYRQNTDFDNYSLFYRAGLSGASAKLDFSGGFNSKDFGANGFYSDKFPNQREATETLFLNLSGNYKHRFFSFSPRLFWRQHSDDFMLDFEHPEFYRNLHTTDVYGAEAQVSVISDVGVTTFAGESGVESIGSQSLGSHSRNRVGLFLEHLARFNNRITLKLAGNGYHYSGYGWVVCPGLDWGYQIKSNLRWYAAAGKSFRIPTFTDLYYVSPANMGNPNLKPEKSITFETGIKLQDQSFVGQVGLFYRKGYDLIDWTRQNEDTPWTVQNISKMDTRGAELSLSVWPDFHLKAVNVIRIKFNYAFLNANRTVDFESKYALNYLKHQIRTQLDLQISERFNNTWHIRFEERVGAKAYALLDSRFTWKQKNIEFYLEGTNLLNQEYDDIGAIPMPGRWLKTGIRFTK